MQDYTSFDLKQLANVFVQFSESECKTNSPLYHLLTRQISEDRALLALAARTRYGQPMPNSVLAAVHYLLLSDTANPLAQYYPSIAGKTSNEIPFHLFKTFCLHHSKEITDLIQHRLVQTNVISRCSYLAPVFSGLINQSDNKNVTLIDIGTSAGLTLLWDKYEYHYSTGLIVGDSPVKVNCEILSAGFPDFPMPVTKMRKIGIDQNLINPMNAEDARWLRALIWPDQLDRFAAMDQALRLKELSQIEFIKADSIEAFKNIILGTDRNDLLIVYCTHALYQFSPEARQEFGNMLDSIGAERDFYFLSAEGIRSIQDKYQTHDTVVELSTYIAGNKSQSLIATTNGHGNWLRWN